MTLAFVLGVVVGVIIGAVLAYSSIITDAEL